MNAAISHAALHLAGLAYFSACDTPRWPEKTRPSLVGVDKQIVQSAFFVLGAPSTRELGCTVNWLSSPVTQTGHEALATWIGCSNWLLQNLAELLPAWLRQQLRQQWSDLLKDGIRCKPGQAKLSSCSMLAVAGQEQ